MSSQIVVWNETWGAGNLPVLHLRPGIVSPLRRFLVRSRGKLLNILHIAIATLIGAGLGEMSGERWFWLATGCLVGTLFTAAGRHR